MICRLLAIACTALLLCACATASVPATGFHTVAERYISAPFPEAELDSLATWRAHDGRTWLIASAKSTHELMVFDVDSGALLRTISGKGKNPGQFNRPNGVAVHGDHLFVVERDNHRLQVFDLPGLQPVASFGEDVLRSPYGLWINDTAPGELDIYVTDSFMYGEHYDIVPPLSELDQRVRRFHAHTDAAGELQINDLGSFGETTEPGALQVVESIAGDAAHDRLLVADERASTLREYTLDGRYTGVSLPSGTFAADAEGIALWPCRNGAGYWIAVDQHAPLTSFHVFERNSLRPVGSFQGQRTSGTDGIALHAASTPAFTDGVLVAVHDDQAVAAFDLADIANALGLSAECTGVR